jgi:hypothetical protein
MIFRRYGATFQSVDTNFDPRALNEVGFRRNHSMAIPADVFEATYERVTLHEIVAEADGPVQDHTEKLLLERLDGGLRELEGKLAPGHVLVLDNGEGPDYPKTRQEMKNVIVEGENRFHFNYTLRPPLRMTEYRKKA